MVLDKLTLIITIMNLKTKKQRNEIKVFNPIWISEFLPNNTNSRPIITEIIFCVSPELSIILFNTRMAN